MAIDRDGVFAQQGQSLSSEDRLWPSSLADASAFSCAADFLSLPGMPNFLRLACAAASSASRFLRLRNWRRLTVSPTVVTASCESCPAKRLQPIPERLPRRFLTFPVLFPCPASLCLPFRLCGPFRVILKGREGLKNPLR